MDFSVIAYIYWIGAILLFVVLLARANTLFRQTEGNQPHQAGRKIYVALQHSFLSLVVITGVILLVLNQFTFESWFYAKIILFFVMLSALIKAYKKDDSILLVQRRAGCIIALVAFCAIYALVVVKPTF